MKKMQINLRERSSLISSNVLAALASTAQAAKKEAVVVRGDLHHKRTAFRARKHLDLAHTRGKSDEAVTKVDGALEKALTALFNDALETALMATLLALPPCTTSSTVANIVDDNLAVSWWSNAAKTIVAGLEQKGPLSSSRKIVNQDCASPKPRIKSIFSGKAFASTSTSVLSSSSMPFDTAAAAGPAFSTQRSVTLEPTSFAVYLEASGIATLRPTTTYAYVKLSAPEVAAVDGASQVESAPALEPVVEVQPPRAEEDEHNEFHGWSKLYQLVDGAWIFKGKGYLQLNEAKVANEEGKKPARICASSLSLHPISPRSLR